MKKDILLLHDLLLLYIVVNLGHFFMEPVVGVPTYVSIARIFNLIQVDYRILYPSFFLITFSVVLLGILHPTPWLRFLTAFCFFILIFLRYSFGGISQVSHIWIWSSFLFTLLEFFQLIKFRVVMNCLYAVFFSSYFNAGIWKVRTLLSLKEINWESLKNSSLEVIGTSVQQGIEMEKPLLKLLLLNYQIFPYLFLVLIIFQVLTILPVAYPILRRSFVVAALLFHVSSGSLLGHWYTDTILMCLFLLFVNSLEDRLQIEE